MTTGYDPRTDDNRAATASDRDLWLRLRAVLVDSPAMTVAPESGGAEAPRETDRVCVPRTVRQIDRLADKVSLALLPPWEPVYPGTAPAVARWLVGVCRSFVQNWSCHPAPTGARLREFHRDVACLVSILDGVVSTAPRAGPAAAGTDQAAER
ncbi:hypothetical protein [Gandjariella thermophila]|uniref:SAV-6107-like HEPN domain-containing protein n=1 Tax=Gandjariella thermophila TaxID=1931992 RepID=A0A4D4J1D8_9PSEU|nr:hypothetical protein [Gandjariella thermophila]GDY28459.1 hypothetical protein GTS_00920 [Gandjariella thermophila]